MKPEAEQDEKPSRHGLRVIFQNTQPDHLLAAPAQIHQNNQDNAGDGEINYSHRHDPQQVARAGGEIKNFDFNASVEKHIFRDGHEGRGWKNKSSIKDGIVGVLGAPSMHIDGEIDKPEHDEQKRANPFHDRSRMMIELVAQPTDGQSQENRAGAIGEGGNGCGLQSLAPAPVPRLCHRHQRFPKTRGAGMNQTEQKTPCDDLSKWAHRGFHFDFPAALKNLWQRQLCF